MKRLLIDVPGTDALKGLFPGLLILWKDYLEVAIDVCRVLEVTIGCRVCFLAC